MQTEEKRSAGRVTLWTLYKDPLNAGAISGSRRRSLGDAKEQGYRSSFCDRNRVGGQKASLLLFAPSLSLSLCRHQRSVSPAATRCPACDALIRPKYTFATRGSPEARPPIRRLTSCATSSLCLSPDTHATRTHESLSLEPLSAFGALRFSVPRQIGNYPFARALGRREIEIN